VKREFVGDVSNNNPITAKEFADSGWVGLICKGTEGVSFTDKTLSTHRRIAARKIFGSYLFLHAASPGNQAGFYLDYVKPKPGELQPIIDAEEGGRDGVTDYEFAARVDRCATALEQRDYEPILYSDVSTWKRLYAANPKLARLPVWEAQYPGRFARWFPRIAKLRLRLGHGATVILWQWTDREKEGGGSFDSSLVLADLDRYRIPKPAG
jgi:GH25 family lysozyme M1 (1,4-beta-N-acetylmuramidase)